MCLGLSGAKDAIHVVLQGFVYCPCGLSHPVPPTVPKIAGCEAFYICLRVIKLFWEGLS